LATAYQPVAVENDPHAVETAVGRLRRRLGTAGAAIKTVQRRGYRLAAELVDPRMS
jgi:DNA-binding winged helix-turn-helix (wHTH) protein